MSRQELLDNLAKTVGTAGSDDPKGLVDVERCPVQTDQANAVLATARKYLIQRADR